MPPFGETNKSRPDELLDPMHIPDIGIVVSGISGRFPNADSLDELKQNLIAGVDMVTDVDDKRWPLGLWGLPKRAGRIKDLSKFDYEFFGFEKTVADFTDSSARLLYETVYEAILDSGVNPASMRGTNTGLFFGFYCAEFDLWLADHPSFKADGLNNQIASKVAQYFDFRGRVCTFDTACASGFGAMHEALLCIQEGTIDQAIVCSSNIPLHPRYNDRFFKLNMLSPTGQCRFLDANANGYVKSEAVVAFLVQRKHTALRNYATILASGTNADGNKTEGYTYPSAKAQEALIRLIKDKISLHSDHVEYIEAHGTGTAVGDPVEARSISQVYCPPVGGERTIGPLYLGSLKTNIGHSEATSGFCSLAKVILMLENETMYKNLHFESKNPDIDSLMDNRIAPVNEMRPLKSKVIPICCYGFGGANVHAIFRANNQDKVERCDEDWLHNEQWRIIRMFGRTRESVMSFFDQIMSSEARDKTLTRDFVALVDSLCSGPIDRLMTHRGFMVVNMLNQKELFRSVGECRLPLSNNRKPTADNNNDNVRPSHFQESQQRPIYFVYPGTGSEWIGMARGLKDLYVFWSTIERLHKVLEPFNFDLIKLLTRDSQEWTNDLIIAITAIEIALTNLLKIHLELKPTGVIGHSFGEIAAGYAANVLEEEECILVSYYAIEFLKNNLKLLEGSMAVVAFGMGEAQQLIGEYLAQLKPNDTAKSQNTLYVACDNGPNSCTISGRRHHMDKFSDYIKKQKGFEFDSSTSYSVAHNIYIMTDDVKKSLTKTLEKAFNPKKRYERNAKHWLDTIFNRKSTPEQHSLLTKFANAEYYANAFCERTDFYRVISQIPEHSLVIECGPSAVFEHVFRSLMSKDKLPYVSLMKRNDPEPSATLFKAFGQIYQSGVTTTLRHLYPAVVFPVGRQTPSIGSLVKWDHAQSLFVPRYPDQFNKYAMSNNRLMVDMTQDHFKYLSGHKIDSRILFPATGYLYYVWRLFSAMLKNETCDLSHQHDTKLQGLVPVEFFNVTLHRAVLLSDGNITKLHLNLQPTIGTFEIKEGEDVIVNGMVRLPKVNENDLLHREVAQKLKSKQLELTLNHSDVYTSFRVNGYDYGDTFRCVQASSLDGKLSTVRFNGHLVSFMDNIVQTLFLAMYSNATAGSVYLPSKFDYARFNPDILREKLEKFKTINSSPTAPTKNEAEATHASSLNEHKEIQEEAELGGDDIDMISYNDVDVIFETYCEPETGIIVTDGIEMRGVRASPAPRREGHEPLLERYQFTADIEEPVADVETSKNGSREYYLAVCSNMVCDLVRTIDGSIRASASGSQPQSNLLALLANGYQSLGKQELVRYKRNNLSVLYSELEKKISNMKKQQEQDDAAAAAAAGHVDEQKIVRTELNKNSPFTLLSLLDSLQYSYQMATQQQQQQPRVESRFAAVKLLKSLLNSLLEQYSKLLMSDMLQSSFTNERYLRPIVETLLENSKRASSNKLNVMAINTDDWLHDRIKDYALNCLPNLSLEYNMAHTNQLINGLLNANNETQLQQSKLIGDLSSSNASCLFESNSVDIALYRDSSCFAPSLDILETSNLKQVLATTCKSIKEGGFLVIMLRNQISVAERFFMAVKNLNVEQYKSHSSQQEMILDMDLVEKVASIKTNLEAREKMLQAEALQSNTMQLVAKKLDSTGCTMLVLKKRESPQAAIAARGDNNKMVKIIHIRHQNYNKWLDELKAHLSQASSGDNDGDDDSRQQRVWLCAVATKDKPMNGVVGLIQCLLKELGQQKNLLRCFFDCCTFKTRAEADVSLEAIKTSANFKLAMARDMFWNCIDSAGRFGSFRHVKINDYFALSKATSHVVDGESDERKTERVYADISIRGDLSSFKWYQSPFSKLAPDSSATKQQQQQSLVKVHYSALNFRDIMLATGKLSTDSLPTSLTTQDCLLGLEFSGVELGGASAKKKRVAGMIVSRAIASHVLCTPTTSIKFDVPDSMSLKDAATIPVVYGTAIMAMIYRGKMQAGESILIHAGSGGVGQAAIRLALHFKLKVFTTVGSQEKRDFILKEFNNQVPSSQIFNSRDCSFETQLMRATKGRGVDLVLNSLADDKLQASIRCLATNGRFLEIGKYDLSIDTKLELSLMDINKSFHGVCIDKFFDTDTVTPYFNEQLNCVMETLSDGIRNGYVKPIKNTCFGKDEIEQAFRFMAAGKHIGKVLIEMEPELEREQQQQQQQLADNKKQPEPQLIRAKSKFQLDPMSTYIVTGGLGGFGLELCKWMASMGARHLIVTSRLGVRSGYHKSVLDKLNRNYNCKTLVVNNKMADGTTLAGVEKLFQYARELSPIKKVGGLFHLAMIIRDKLFESMTNEDFELVCRPKADGCILLDQVSRKVAPDMSLFVAFSSVSCGKGNAGQTNYGYANSIMERVCEQRRHDKLHGLAIQWGAIGDVGFAHENLGGNDTVIAGSLPQRMHSCFSTLTKLLITDFAVCSSIVLADEIKSSDDSAEVDLVGTLLHILGIKDADKVEETSTLGELGLDSLMVVEASQAIERHRKVKLSVQEIRALTLARTRDLGVAASPGAGAGAGAGASS